MDMVTELLHEKIRQGSTSLGLELGSTRIKAVLVDDKCTVIASGSCRWESRLENGYWTYRLEDVWAGIQTCYQRLAKDVEARYALSLKTIGAIGISAMMHGYLPFDAEDRLLVPFRTWKNTSTEQAAEELSSLFSCNIPQRWSIAHLHQAILDREEHVPRLNYLTTLSGYVHWMLTGEKVLGIGDASGMFPIDSSVGNYRADLLTRYQERIAGHGFAWSISGILPKVYRAGEPAGVLSEQGAKLLDPSGTLEAGIPFAPPEGDAGTGMVATNSISPKTGNVSAGTSVFAMVVLDQPLKKTHTEIDMVTTPTGQPVAMVHCNNCTSDLNAWAELFKEAVMQFGFCVDDDTLFAALYQAALEGAPDCGGLLSYNYSAGEPVNHLPEGRPLFVRTPSSRFCLANFMKAHLFSAVAALRMGLDILFQEEHVVLHTLVGHGGYFKTPEVGQRFMAAAIETPVAILETAGEGGAWGMALLAEYVRTNRPGRRLEVFLNDTGFVSQKTVTQTPIPEDVQGFQQYLARYRAGLEIERSAICCLHEE